MRTALTIAGSDSSGGAGIQADLKTFAALGVYGTSAITAVTAQNTLGISAIMPVTPEMVAAQIEAVIADLGADAVKIGMLGTAANADVVAGCLARHHLANVVLDPVMIATHGARLLDEDGVAILCSRLLGLATVVTPNLAEAAALTGLPVRTMQEMRAAAMRLSGMGAHAVIVKGGHLDAAPIDVLYDGRTFTELPGDRVDTRHIHGTGCTFSSAIAARLALGDSLIDAFRAAKTLVTCALQQAPGLGHGQGPLGHKSFGSV
jgi:hydroxymethylpyrimidine/phosphomethylpyrimidine kinase